MHHRKHRKLTDFAKKKQEREDEAWKAESNVKRLEEKPGEEGSVVDSNKVFEEVLAVIAQKQRATTQREVVSEVAQVETSETQATRGKVEVAIEVGKREEKLFEVAYEAFAKKDIKIIECNKQGTCTDGKKLGEVFEDSRGLKWQRSFVNTTRLPIFLDFIAENAQIKGRVGKASIVVLASGARAIIPDEYLCEVVKRLGVLIDIDKCSNYKTSPWAERTRRKQK